MMHIKQNGRDLWLAAAILWMALVFGFSHQKAAESSEISGSVTYRMAEGVNRVFGLGWEEEALTRYAQLLEHPVRKAAHMTEFAVLACILLGNCFQYTGLRKKAYLWAWLGTTAYAATDEFHQLFIEGRSGEFKDVCIDSLGACIGLLAARCAIWIWGNIFYRKR